MALTLEAVRNACTRHLSGPKMPSALRTEVEWARRVLKLAEQQEERRGARPLDSHGEGATLREVEAEVATLLGKEGALLCVRGVAGQQALLRAWTEVQGKKPADPRTVALHPISQIAAHEYEGYRELHGFEANYVGRVGAHFTARDLDAMRRPADVVVAELPLKSAGYRLPRWEEYVGIAEWCRSNNVPLHLDGARLPSAAGGYGLSLAELAAPADSVYFCLYKDMPGLSGCVLASDNIDLLERAQLWVARQGADAARSQFHFALTALDALKTSQGRFVGTGRRTNALAEELDKIPYLSTTPPVRSTSLALYFPTDEETMTAAHMATAAETKLWLFNKFHKADQPNTCLAYVALDGAGSEEISNDEIVGSVADMLGRIDTAGWEPPSRRPLSYNHVQYGHVLPGFHGKPYPNNPPVNPHLGKLAR